MSLEPVDSSDRERRVADVLAEYFAAVESGEGTDRQAVLAAHPELAAELAEYFEQQDRFARLVEPLRPVAAGVDTTATSHGTAIFAEGESVDAASGSGTRTPEDMGASLDLPGASEPAS